jgi:hypothetical protein
MGKVVNEGFINQEDCLRVSDDERINVMIKYLETIEEKQQACQ